MTQRNVFLFLVFISLLASCDTKGSFDQPDENYFLKYFGNEGDQQGVDFVVNPDGTFILLGNSRIKPDTTQQIYVAKSDAKGKVIWEKTFGGNFDEEAKDIELLADGSLIVLANSEIAKGNRDVYLLKMTQEGDIIKTVKKGLKKYNGEDADEDASTISITSKGFIVSGSTNAVSVDASTGLPAPSDVTDAMHLLFRSDLTWVDDLTGLWKSRTTFASFSFIGEEKAIKVFEFNSNTFYVMAYTNTDPSGNKSVSDFNFVIYGLNGFGDAYSNRLFTDDPGDEKLSDCSISPSQSGAGYRLSGISKSSSGTKIYMVQLQQQLSFVKSDFFNPTKLGEEIDLGSSALQITHNYSSPLAGSYITTEKLNGTSTDIFLTKRDNRGQEVFSEVLGGIGDDLSGSVMELPDGRIAMIGTMTLGGVVNGQKKIVFMKLNPGGKLAP